MVQTSSIAALIAIVSLIGCNRNDDKTPVYRVSGSAKYKGESMSGAIISFHPLLNSDPRALRAQATADKDGCFKLTTYSTDDGAPAGNYAVTIYWPLKIASRTQQIDPSAEDKDIPPDRLNRAFADPKTTKLRATVSEQSNVIELVLP